MPTMLLCSSERQQNQWTWLHCLYLPLVKSALPEGPYVTQRAKLGWFQTVWQGSALRQSPVVSPAPSLMGEILGSFKSCWFQRGFSFLGSLSHKTHRKLLALSCWEFGICPHSYSFLKANLLPSLRLGQASPGSPCQGTAASQRQLHGVSQCN